MKPVKKELRDTFVEEYGAELLQRIFENIYEDRKDSDMTVDRTFTDRDGINSYGTVIIARGESELVVEFRDGNWNGSEIKAYWVE
jgi:hypothetical protein